MKKRLGFMVLVGAFLFCSTLAWGASTPDQPATLFVSTIPQGLPAEIYAEVKASIEAGHGAFFSPKDFYLAYMRRPHYPWAGIGNEVVFYQTQKGLVLRTGVCPEPSFYINAKIEMTAEGVRWTSIRKIDFAEKRVTWQTFEFSFKEGRIRPTLEELSTSINELEWPR